MNLEPNFDLEFLSNGQMTDDDDDDDSFNSNGSYLNENQNVTKVNLTKGR